MSEKDERRASAAADGAEERSGASDEAPVRRLLVVDDEAGPRQSLSMIFDDSFEVVVAESGEEALRRLDETECSVAITDIRMPGMDGIEVLRRIKERSPSTQAIVLTAYETLESAREAISLGAADYLRKPFDLNHIQTVVERAQDAYLANARRDALIRRSVNAAKTNFLEIVSHELYTPMNGILGFIDLLDDTPLNEEQREYLAMVRQCSVRYFENVQDILAYARLATGIAEVSRKSFNPGALAFRLVADHEAPQGVELRSDVAEDLPPLIFAAEDEIRIAVRKLVQNGLKFTREGEVRLSAEWEDGWIIYTVSDTGQGIPPEDLESRRIFDAFAQSDSSRNRSYGGLGLGLSLGQTLADRIGARLTAESRPGEGSSFRFAAPAERVGGDASGA